ncbi:MAG: hypothetical protein IJZ56_00540 [Oscillospiraceae bacterium]|nr:hypothetical protein [Oscillospiraceae bacterium]
MKKPIAFLLALCLCMVLCACGAGNGVTTNVSKDSTADLEETGETHNTQYVGVWESGGHEYGDGVPYMIEFLNNGKALLHNNRGYDITQAPWLASGDWYLDGNRIIILFMTDGFTQARVFYIRDAETIELAGLDLVYSKR